MKLAARDRVKDHALVLDGGKITSYAGDALVAYRQREDVVGESLHHIERLDGQAACAGMAVGTVRVVNGPQDLEKVQKGDILIAAATSPAYVPAMQRAGAIVTNEGGLLCHAAIVSRELGIPCVVGTKVATRVFRDGERVSVDAIHGSVRKV